MITGCLQREWEVCSDSRMFAAISGYLKREWDVCSGSGIIAAGAGFALWPIDSYFNIGSIATVWLRAERAELMGPCSAQQSAGTPAR